MARFVYDEAGDYPVARLEAKQGEELSTEVVVAWAAMKQSYALHEIADRMVELDNAISGVGSAIYQK